MSRETVLNYMIQNDLLDHKKYMVSHHLVESPNRIDVMADEVIYIDKLTVKPANIGFWVEFHSATDSRIVETENYEQITRHKGHIYFSNKEVDSYTVSFVKLKLIDNKL